MAYWRDMNWAREVISPVAGKMAVAATLDNELTNYGTGTDLAATGAVAYAAGKHHEGYEATGAVKLVETFSSFNLQDGFALGCHFHAIAAFDADCNDFHELLTLWDGANIANGYLRINLDYRDGQKDGLRITSNNGASREAYFENMDIAADADHSIVVTGKYDTATDTGKILIYLDGYLVNGRLLTNANQIFDAAAQLEVGNYTTGTGYAADCNIGDVFVQSAFIEDPEVVFRYHNEGLNLDCVNDGKVFNPGYRVFGYERNWTADDYDLEVMAYDPETERVWGAGATGTTYDTLYYANEDGTGRTLAHHFDGANERVMSVVVIGENLFACVRNVVTGVNKLYKSDKTTISWTAVLTLVTHFYAIAGWSGPIRTPSGNLFFAEYGGPLTGGDPANIYRSTDAGDTWASSDALDAPDGTARHYHGIFYDPYRDYVWTAWGDGTSYHGVGYTDDDGDTWTDLFTHATTNLTDVFGSLQSIRGYATRNGCVWPHDCRAQNPANAFWWDAQYDHGYDGAGAGMQRWSALGSFLSPNDPHIFAIHKAKNGTTWMMGNKEANESDYCIYLSHNDCRTMVLADNPSQIGPYSVGCFVETKNYIWQGAARFRNWAKVIPA